VKKVTTFQIKARPGESRKSQDVGTRAEFDIVLGKTRELALKAPQKAAMILTEWLKKTPIQKKKAG
jgi:hypothetical protein